LDLIVRPADANDVSAVRQCVVEAFSPYIARIGKHPAPMLLDFEVHTWDRHVWVAELDGAVVGVLVQYETPDGFYIDTVAAAPRQQGRGVGRRLLVFAEQEALRRGFGSLYLCTNSKMVENQALYAKVGYVEYGRKHMAGYDRIFYRKPLQGRQQGEA
jgi:GNAT superfamily N-acetyltransferase